MHLLQKQAVIFQKKVKREQKVSHQQSHQIRINFQLMLCDSVAVNVNKQVIRLPAIINHVNDFGNLDWLMVEFDENKTNPLSF